MSDLSIMQVTGDDGGITYIEKPYERDRGVAFIACESKVTGDLAGMYLTKVQAALIIKTLTDALAG